VYHEVALLSVLPQWATMWGPAHWGNLLFLLLLLLLLIII
jgi:hypothetical protein